MMLSTLNRGVGIDIAAMVARHGDADLIGEAMRQFDVTLVRGAGAGHRKKDRGGSYALRACTRALQDGKTVVMTADVPPGPARTVGQGIIQLARMSGRPIIPIAPATSRFKSFRTWSRMTVNLPFSKLAFVAGKPIEVPRDANAEVLEALRRELQDELNVATRRAYQLVGRDVNQITPNHARETQAAPPATSNALKVYRAATQSLRFAAPSILKRRERRGKEDLTRRGERLGNPSQPRPDGPLVWLHAASVGETNAIAPIIQGLKQRRPDLNILLTTGTTTSAAVATERLSQCAIHQYVPIDVPSYVRRFLDHWRPDLAVLTESEIWPNLILESKARGTPITLVNGRMSSRSFSRWKARLKTAEALFGRIETVLCQDDLMAYRFQQLGVRNVIKTGNLKYDAAPPPIDPEAHLELTKAIGVRPIWLAASTHAPEESIIGEAHRRLAATANDLLTIIVPRHPARGVQIAEDLKMQGLRVAQRSDGLRPDNTTDIYIADTIGEIGTFFALAPVAFIGGSLSETGGHNPIEAIKRDCAVITGPHIKNFEETYQQLLSNSAALSVASDKELADAVARLLQNSVEASSMVTRARHVIETKSGALDVTLDVLLASAMAGGQSLEQSSSNEPNLTRMDPNTPSDTQSNRSPDLERAS
ncbi:MAG: glycosyltransferase N-terminal domain-containing protein [Pseudomonadota bacterium]